MSAGPRPEPAPATGIVAVLAGDSDLAAEAVAELAEPHGGVERRGPRVAFDHTDYYEVEMGSGLTRQLFSFRDPVAPDRLPDLKHAAWKIEQRHAREGRRRVNLDVGYLDATRVVLASFKPGPYKLYVGEQVWADLVLYYGDGRWQPLPWTFPDLTDEQHVHFLTNLRGLHKGR